MGLSSNKGSLVINCITNKSSNTMKNAEVIEYLKYLPTFFGIRLLLKPLDILWNRKL